MIDDLEVGKREYALEEAKKFYNIAEPPIKQVMEGLTVDDYVGFGSEKTVFDLQSTLVGIFFRGKFSVNHIKAEFYVRKLARLLVPNCLPDVRWAAVRPPMLAVEKVEGDEACIFHERLIEKTVDEFKSAGLGVDSFHTNFIIDSTGKAVYVDSPYRLLNQEKLQASVANLPQNLQAQAAVYISRLELLEGSDQLL